MAVLEGFCRNEDGKQNTDFPKNMTHSLEWTRWYDDKKYDLELEVQ